MAEEKRHKENKHDDEGARKHKDGAFALSESEPMMLPVFWRSLWHHRLPVWTWVDGL